jgi:hypothetical protein
VGRAPILLAAPPAEDLPSPSVVVTVQGPRVGISIRSAAVQQGILTDLVDGLLLRWRAPKHQLATQDDGGARGRVIRAHMEGLSHRPDGPGVSGSESTYGDRASIAALGIGSPYQRPPSV